LAHELVFGNYKNCTKYKRLLKNKNKSYGKNGPLKKVTAVFPYAY
jgi:hypothetical protein